MMLAFEAKVRSARNGALLIACLHLLSRFLGLCAITCATDVVLGGFASALSTFDFFFVIDLLILEGARLFIVHAFGMFQESHRPEEFDLKEGNLVDLVGQAVSVIFAVASLMSIAVRFILQGMSHTISDDDSARKDSNLGYALYILSMIVIVNFFLAIASALLRPFLRSQCEDRSPLADKTLIRYHDEVYKMAMHAGLRKAAQLDIFKLAYTKLSSDYKRNILPKLIKAQNKDLISYLYHNQRGIAMCCKYLKSDDVWKKLVAANLPGFWVEEQRIELQVALFWALHERMYGAGKDAESALNSIECLAQSWVDMPTSKPYPFLIDDPITATNIVDTLVQLLLQPIPAPLLFQLRAFEACCRNQQVLQHMYGGRSPQEAQELCRQLQASIVSRRQEMTAALLLQKLCHKLFALYVSDKGTWMTTKICAGNALLSLLCYASGEVAEETMKCLQGPLEEYKAPAKARGDGAGLSLNDMILLEKMMKKLYTGWLWIKSKRYSLSFSPCQYNIVTWPRFLSCLCGSRLPSHRQNSNMSSDGPPSLHTYARAPFFHEVEGQCCGFCWSFNCRSRQRGCKCCSVGGVCRH